MKNLILVNGTMGVGKTTVCETLLKTLPNAVFLDGDWCWRADPFVVNESTKAMVIGNITHLLGSFLHEDSYQNIVFCWVMHRQEILDDLLGRLDLDGVCKHVFTLTASENILRARLEKDIAAGLRQRDIVTRSVDRIGMYDDIDSVKICTDELVPEDAARVITERMAVK